jgi:hypothetical protein
MSLKDGRQKARQNTAPYGTSPFFAAKNADRKAVTQLAPFGSQSVTQAALARLRTRAAEDSLEQDHQPRQPDQRKVCDLAISTRHWSPPMNRSWLSTQRHLPGTSVCNGARQQRR